MVYALNQHPICGIVRIHGSRNHKLEKAVVLLTITPCDPLGKFLLPLPLTLSSAGLELLVPEEGVLLPGDTTNIPLNWKLILPLDHFGFLMPLNQQAKKRITVLGGVINPVTMGKLDCFSILEVRKIMSGVQEILWSVSW